MKYSKTEMKLTGGVLLVGLVIVGAFTPVVATTSPLGQVNHIIIIYQENWSFDSLYGRFPGANGIANAGSTIVQVDRNGQPYSTLPQPLNTTRKPYKADNRFPTNLPVRPYDLTQYAPNGVVGDPGVGFYQEQLQINGGRMDKFVAWSQTMNGGLALGYYDATSFPEGRLAQQYVLDDNFFHAAYGGSWLNAQWLICACTPVWPNAPASMVAKITSNGTLLKDGAVTPDGYAVNTVYSIDEPHPANVNATNLLPLQTMPTIGDRLTAANITWAWYSGGWNNATSGKPDPLFQYHHQPFVYFANYAVGTTGRSHLKDYQDFLVALQGNNLPSVSFIKAIGEDNEHPGYASLMAGQNFVASTVQAIQQSNYWSNSLIIVTYDENGGFWDHVPPPKLDRWGDGTRVPTVVISPFAKQGYIDHTQYDTTSILKLIEDRYALQPLGTRDATANDLASGSLIQLQFKPAGGKIAPLTLPLLLALPISTILLNRKKSTDRTSNILSASRVVAGLLAVVGLLGAVILGFDQILRFAPLHTDALIAFIAIDFVMAGLALRLPSASTLTAAAVWSTLRIMLQIGDIATGPQFHFAYAAFVNFLFNPTLTTPGNPTGVPGALIDLIIALQVVVICVAWRIRSSANVPV